MRSVSGTGHGFGSPARTQILTLAAITLDMDRLGKVATSIWTILLVVGGLFFALLVWGVSFMGDTIYSLQIQNNRTEGLKLKTYRITRYDQKLTVDSLVLEPNDKLEIGTSHSCSTIDSMYLDFDAIEFYDSSDNSKLLKRKELIDFLLTMERRDCSTYLVK